MPSDSTFSTSFIINYPTTDASNSSCGTTTITTAQSAPQRYPKQVVEEWWSPDPAPAPFQVWDVQATASAPRKKGTSAGAGPQFEGLSVGSELLVFYKRNHRGYEEGHRHQGEVIYQNVQDLLARFFIKVHYESSPISNWREWCIGITSDVFQDSRGQRATGSLHMPMFDYDGKNIKSILRKDVQLLQKKWGLGAATLFQTKKGFHVYFMTDVVNWKAYYEMLNEAKCCEGFKRCALNNGHGVLRVSAKYSTFDIKKDSVMLPEKAKALPARKIRKAHVIEALLDLGMRCGTHFASLCSKWAQYHEDETPWKQVAKTKKPTAKAELGDKYAFPPAAKAEFGGMKRPKLILKPRRPDQIEPPEDNPGMKKNYAQEQDLGRAFFYEPPGTHGTSATGANKATGVPGEFQAGRPYRYVEYKKMEQKYASIGAWQAEQHAEYNAARGVNATTQPTGQTPENPDVIKFDSLIGISVKETMNKIIKENFLSVQHKKDVI